MKAVPVLVLALALAAGCGANDRTAAPREKAHAAEAPTTAAPSIGKNGPPAAWIETKEGSRWLGFSSYCWSHREGNQSVGLCADFAGPSCGDKRTPDISVHEGENVRAHLGFTPAEASIENAAATVDGRVVEWRVRQAGPFSLFTRPQAGGDASYVGCAVFTAAS